MLTDISEARWILFFIEGLEEPLKALVKAYRSSTFQDALNITRDLQYIIPRTGFPPRSNALAQFKNQRPPPMKSPSGNFRGDNFSRDRDELMRIKLCFTCQ